MNLQRHAPERIPLEPIISTWLVNQRRVQRDASTKSIWVSAEAPTVQLRSVCNSPGNVTYTKYQLVSTKNNYEELYVRYTKLQQLVSSGSNIAEFMDGLLRKITLL